MTIMNGFLVRVCEFGHNHRPNTLRHAACLKSPQEQHKPEGKAGRYGGEAVSIHVGALDPQAESNHQLVGRRGYLQP